MDFKTEFKKRKKYFPCKINLFLLVFFDLSGKFASNYNASSRLAETVIGMCFWRLLELNNTYNIGCC